MVTTRGNLNQEDEAGDFIYYDHTIGKTFKFNPIDLKSEVVSSDPVDVPTSPLRDEVCKLMDKYMSTYYMKGIGKYNIFLEGDKMIIEISCINTNLSNYWSGEW